jgi:DNA-damage-inducible protein D
MENSNLIPFEEKEIRKVIHNDEWYFSIFDIIQNLTDTTNPKRYWNDLKRRDPELDKQGGTQISYPLKMQTAGGKQSVLCANTEGVLRIVMSVPSPKAEPLRMWLAEQGARTLEETANPELLTQRQIDLYKLKGRSEEWIKERMQSIETRTKLTDEWQKRDVKEGREYSILTAIIAKGTFGVTPTEHRDIKGLSKSSQNLRDHMTDLELIFTSLSEATTRRLAIQDDAQGFDENKNVAAKGGQASGAALNTYEAKTGLKVVSNENFLKASDDTKELPTDSNE